MCIAVAYIIFPEMRLAAIVLCTMAANRISGFHLFHLIVL
jgi:hypothetical protein